LLIGVLCALGAATLYAAGIALQSLDARRAHSSEELRPSLLISLVQRPRWVVGGVVSLLGWPLQALALANAPIAVVQPALAFNLVVLLVIVHVMTPGSVTRGEVLGAIAISVGVVCLALAAPTQGGNEGTRTIVLVVVLGVASALPLILRRQMLRVSVLLPAVAGIGFTLLAVATTLAEDAFGDQRWLVCAVWLAVTGGAAYAATVCEMTALRTRAPTFVVPMTVSVESVLPIVVAPIALAEHLPTSTGARLTLAVGIALILSGVFVLGRDPALAELHVEPTT
jgi:hypothetical protein